MSFLYISHTLRDLMKYRVFLFLFLFCFFTLLHCLIKQTNLAVFEILRQPCCCFLGVLNLVSLLFLAVVIRRLLYVPDHEVSSLNSS